MAKVSHLQNRKIFLQIYVPLFQLEVVGESVPRIQQEVKECRPPASNGQNLQAGDLHSGEAKVKARI